MSSARRIALKAHRPQEHWLQYCKNLSLLDNVKFAWYGNLKLTTLRPRGFVVQEELLSIVMHTTL